MKEADILKELCTRVCLGPLTPAVRQAQQYFDGCKITPFFDHGFQAFYDCQKHDTLLLEAHIDQVGFTVTAVLSDGFLQVAACGGIDLRTLPARQVLVHGKEEIPAVFTSTPPHLQKAEETFSDIHAFYLDTGLHSGVEKLVCVGDFVTYTPHFQPLLGNRICATSFDDRAGVAALVHLYERVKGKDLPCNLLFQISNAEELGLRGAVTAAYGCQADEAICLDVSFGNAPGIQETDCGKIGGGTMIGFSPILSRGISASLRRLAKERKIAFQCEIMGETTGTDADVISLTQSGIPCGLLSIPIRNMHTDCEILSLSDLTATVDLLEAYIEKKAEISC